MGAENQGWNPYGECSFYTHAGIDLPEGLSIADAMAQLTEERVVGNVVTLAADEHGVRSWDVTVDGLPRRMNSTREGSVTVWAERGRFGSRDVQFESLVCRIRAKVEGARIQIYT